MVRANLHRAWVTLLTIPGYLPATLVLHHSLNAVGSKYPLIVMVSHDLPKDCRDILTIRGIETVLINKLSAKVQNPKLHLDERFKETWSKLKCFDLNQFDRIVLLDSDMIVRRNMDELLEMPLADDCIAAAHACACNPRKLAHYPADWKPENCAYSHPVNPPPMDATSPRAYGLLNSGLVVCNPSEKLYDDIERFLDEDPRVETFQFPDQDLLATFFEGKWTPLPYYYNALKTLRTIHGRLWNDEDVKCLHYILSDKPWTYRPKRNGPPQSDYHDIDLWWWDSFERLGSEFEKMNTKESKRAWQYLQTHVANK